MSILFLLVSLMFITWKIISSANRQFYFFLSELGYFVSFSCLIALAKIFSTVLNRIGESRNPCPVFNLRRKAFRIFSVYYFTLHYVNVACHTFWHVHTETPFHPYLIMKHVFFSCTILFCLLTFFSNFLSIFIHMFVLAFYLYSYIIIINVKKEKAFPLRLGTSQTAVLLLVNSVEP
jgi:hypothetical protein